MPPKVIHSVKGVDFSTAAITIDWSACIGCHGCVRACDAQGINVYQKTKIKYPPFVVSHENPEAPSIEGNTDTTRLLLKQSNCIGCGQCVLACPTSAITSQDDIAHLDNHADLGKHMVALISPSARVGISEAMGLPTGTNSLPQLIAGLRKAGFSHVFDVQFGADLTTLEDTREVMQARAEGTGPVFTSCCPAWVQMAETMYPDLLPRVSTAKSCVAMVASLVKKRWAPTQSLDPANICVVSIMPCTAKKQELLRPQLTHRVGDKLVRDVDLCLTITETATLLKRAGVTFAADAVTSSSSDVEGSGAEGRFDPPFKVSSGGSNIFGRTGGVAETVLRCIAKQADTELLISRSPLWTLARSTQSIEILTAELDGETYSAAVAHGGSALRHAADLVRAGELKVDLVEMMACAGGCVGGGGMKKCRRKAEFAKRGATLEALDASSSFASAPENASLVHEMKELDVVDGDAVHCELHTDFCSGGWRM